VVRDLAGNVISADAVGRPTEFRLGGFSIHKAMPSDEHYFGLGDKAGTFDRRNQAFTLWNTDIGTQEAIDPSTRASRFSSPSAAGATTGFFDNTWRAGSTSARKLATPILSARKVDRLTTTLFMAHSETCGRSICLPYRDASASTAVDPGLQQSRYSYLSGIPDP